MSTATPTLALILAQCSLVLTCLAQPDPAILEKPLSIFFETKFEQALPLFEEIANKDQNNVEAQTWLAETYRRLGRTDDAIRSARAALALNPCYGFAHLVLAQASYPDRDSVRVHVLQAVACDSTDPNAWLMMWGEAIRDNDLALRNKSLRKLIETDFFTTAALAYGRAELRTLPRNAILFTNGDMDTYPAQAVQVTENFRPDVAVIEREHLGIPWAYRFIRDHQEVALPFPDSQLDLMKDSTGATGTRLTVSDQIFRELIHEKREGRITRPIAVAPTVDEEFFSWDKKYFKDHGMFFLWQEIPDDGTLNIAEFRTCLAGIDPDSFRGPWASTKDRSPVRRYYTKGIVEILFDIALKYSEALLKVKKNVEAEETLKWLEDFEMKTEVGNISKEQIARLRISIQQTIH